ncbi:MAG: ribonuclease domain-containing protein [Saprospiraceae bacterium]
MVKNYGQFLGGLIVGLVLGVLISGSNFLHPKVSIKQEPSGSSVSIPVNKPEISVAKPIPTIAGSKIPQKVRDILSYIKAHHRAPDGNVGGRVFSNREKLLPIQDEQHHVITYQEWDVNPKIQNQNRDAERIITGSNGRSWYSDDHYKSFTEIL